MKRQISIIILILILLSTIASVQATNVFLTSDSINNHNTDYERLNSIKEYIEQISNGELNVTIDKEAPSPGETTRAVESNSKIIVCLGCVDCASLKILADSSIVTNQTPIFVNMGDFDLDNEKFIRRAWDDNYSNSSFAGMKNPGKYLKDSGVIIIQPAIKYPDTAKNGIILKNDDKVNKYIAEQIVKGVDEKINNRTLDKNLIVLHKLAPKEMAKASQSLVNNPQDMESTYNSYSAPQLLYLTSSYLKGSALDNPTSFKEPSSPLKYSLFTKKSYSYSDYLKMASQVKDYMDENGCPPDYINYEGAFISYYDLVYNFALITQIHTDYKHMDFNKTYEFHKYNDSVLLNILPFLVVFAIILFIIIIIRYLKKRFKRPPKIR